MKATAAKPRAWGRGDTLIFSYIRRLGPFFFFFFGGGGGQNLEFHYFFVGGGRGFQKNKYFFGYEDFMDIFWGSSQNWTSFRGVISM